MATVQDIYNIVNEIAPFERAESWDNVGLLAGSMKNEVTGVYCALDFSEAVLQKALEKGANLIVTHHPILFKPRKNLREDDYEGRLLCSLVRSRVNLIAAHTNYDCAQGGVSDILARTLGLTDVETIEEDTDFAVRIGNLSPVTLKEFTENVSKTLNSVVRAYGDERKLIRRVAVCGGAGGEYARLAYNAGADAYVTGEMRYHDALDLSYLGFATLQAGHDGTERIAIKPLSEGLQKRAHELQYHLNVYNECWG